MAGFKVTLHGRFWVTPEARYASVSRRTDERMTGLPLFSRTPLLGRVRKKIEEVTEISPEPVISAQTLHFHHRDRIATTERPKTDPERIIARCPCSLRRKLSLNARCAFPWPSPTTTGLAGCDTIVVNGSSTNWVMVTAGWVAVIFFSSTTLAGRWSEMAFRSIATVFFGPTLRPGNALYSVAHLLADKGFHVALFVVLAILVWICLPGGSRKITFIILIGAVIGSISEYLQSFFPGRDPAIRDVIINVAGTALGTLTMLLLAARFAEPPSGPVAYQFGVATGSRIKAPVSPRCSPGTDSHP